MLAELPARARTGSWVVTADHCFGRIVLDNTVGGCWYDVLGRRGAPAFTRLDDDQLTRAVGIAESVAAGGDQLLRELNDRSLAWRHKPARGVRSAVRRARPSVQAVSDTPAGPGGTDAVPPPGGVPSAGGRARDLTRRSTRRRVLPETGRMHHLGAAPEWMPILGADGSQVGRTRVSALQLASRTRFQLERLLGDAEAKMRAAATDADYEKAAHHRDEAAVVRAELDRRAGPPG